MVGQRSRDGQGAAASGGRPGRQDLQLPVGGEGCLQHCWWGRGHVWRQGMGQRAIEESKQHLRYGGMALLTRRSAPSSHEGPWPPGSSLCNTTTATASGPRRVRWHVCVITGRRHAALRMITRGMECPCLLLSPAPPPLPSSPIGAIRAGMLGAAHGRPWHRTAPWPAVACGPAVGSCRIEGARGLPRLVTWRVTKVARAYPPSVNHGLRCDTSWVGAKPAGSEGGSMAGLAARSRERRERRGGHLLVGLVAVML